MQIDGAGSAALAAVQQIGSLREPPSAAPVPSTPIQSTAPQQSQSLQHSGAPIVGLSGSHLSAQAVTTLQQSDGSGLTRQIVGGRAGDDTRGGAGAEDASDASSRQPQPHVGEDGSDGLTTEEEAVVRELQRRDAEVRRHEQAHAAAGGRFAGAPSYEYERGPDGRLYAIGGEVSIDTSPIPGDPQATIAKAQQVRRAALAPTQPSPQDRRVATEAQQQIAQARADLRTEQAEARAEEAESRRESSESVEATRGDSEGGNASALGEATQRADAVRQAAGTSQPSIENGQQPVAIVSTDLASRSLQAGQAFSQSLALNDTAGSPRQARGFF